MGNFAAIDCGTLSTRLLISTPRASPIVRLMRVTGLGQGVDRLGLCGPTRSSGLLSVLREYRGLMDRHGVSAARMVGTSALRDAANRASFSHGRGRGHRRSPFAAERAGGSGPVLPGRHG